MRYYGQSTLIACFAYFLPMKAVKTLLFDTGAVGLLDLVLVVLLATLAGVVALLELHRMVQGGPLRWLLERPAWTRVGTKATAAFAPGRASRPVAVGTISG